MKTCSKCLCPQEDVQFYKKAGRDGLNCWCKTCFRLYEKTRCKNMPPEQRAAKNEEEKLRARASRARDKLIPEVRARRRLADLKRRLKRRYGTTLETWSQMLSEQGGVCDICKAVPPRGFVVDHDHTTRKLRGLLCSQCNCALGNLKESPAIAESLIRYINKHNTPS